MIHLAAPAVGGRSTSRHVGRGEARYLLRSPYASACPHSSDQLLRLRTDCGSHVQRRRVIGVTAPADGTRAGVRVMVAGGLGPTPPAQASKSSPSREDLLPRRSDPADVRPLRQP